MTWKNPTGKMTPVTIMMTAITRTRSLCLVLFALSALLAMASRPATAQRQVVDLVLDPGSPSGQAGAALPVTGTLTNTGTTSVDLDNFYFNLLNGPASADLTSAIFFSDYLAPQTLGPRQTYTGTLFTLGTDPGAPVGDYQGNFTFAYGSQVIGRDINMIITAPVQPSAVPEPGTLILTLPAFGLLALAARRRAAARP